MVAEAHLPSELCLVRLQSRVYGERYRFLNEVLSGGQSYGA